MLVDDSEVAYVHQNGKLNVTLAKSVSPGTNLTVTVLYHGKPRDGLILTKDKDGTPSAVGDNWPDRVHHWIPCLDHPSAKATVNFTISAPSPYVAIANGRLTKVEKMKSAARLTYTEGVPIPAYCMVIGVGEFSQREPEQSTSIPISYLVPYSDREYSIKGFGRHGHPCSFFFYSSHRTLTKNSRSSSAQHVLAEWRTRARLFSRLHYSPQNSMRQ